MPQSASSTSNLERTAVTCGIRQHAATSHKRPRRLALDCAEPKFWYTDGFTIAMLHMSPAKESVCGALAAPGGKLVAHAGAVPHVPG